MTDYGFKAPAQMKVFVPMPHPNCVECGAQLVFEFADKARMVAVLRHPVALAGLLDCSFANRLFEIEMDVRYLKEVKP